MAAASMNLIFGSIAIFVATVTADIIDLGGDKIVLEDFSDTGSTKFWYTVNDPVVGGNSSATFKYDTSLGRLKGEVKTLQITNSPGFVGMQAEDSFPDVSTCEGVEITGRAPTGYGGFRFAFGAAHADDMKYGRGYKAPFTLPSEVYGTVKISFADFSDNWDEVSGDVKISCRDDNQYCPKTVTLQNLAIVSVWGEGVNGIVDLELKTIKAYDCITDNDGDFFKRLIDIFGSKIDEDVNASYNDDHVDTSTSTILSIIAIATGGVAILTSLLAIVSVWRLRRSRATAPPVVEAPEQPAATATESDNQIL